jgi:beta,beta-carotene 9',10'-dioxygenase
MPAAPEGDAPSAGTPTPAALDAALLFESGSETDGEVTVRIVLAGGGGGGGGGTGAAASACPPPPPLPPWLRGALYRNGPGAFLPGLRHLFDGYALLHRIGLPGDGTARVTSRLLASASYQAAVAAGGVPVRREFGTEPSPTLRGRLATLLAGSGASDNANVHILAVHDQLVALTEAPLAHVLHPATLRTVAPWASAPAAARVRGEVACITTAHALVQPDSGALVSFATRFALAPAFPAILRLQCAYDITITAPLPGEGAAPPAIAPPAIAPAPAPAPPTVSGVLAAFDAGVRASTVTHRVPFEGAPSYQHSFGLTRAHAVMTECPFTFSPAALLRTMLVSPGPVTDMFEWAPSAANPGAFRVVSLATGAQVARLPLPPSSPPFFAFHHVNAYEEEVEDAGEGEGGGEGEGEAAAAGAGTWHTAITLDVAAYASPAVIHDFHLHTLRAGVFTATGSTWRRFRIHLPRRGGGGGGSSGSGGSGGGGSGGGWVEELPMPIVMMRMAPQVQGRAAEGKGSGDGGGGGGAPLLLGRDFSFEMPAVAPAVVARPYRFAYAVRARPAAFIDGLLKVDVHAGTAVAWEEAGTSPSEPTFVPAPGGGAGEDDGVVLSLVLSAPARASFLLLLDARTFTEIGRAWLPAHVPMTFHGSWVPAERRMGLAGVQMPEEAAPAAAAVGSGGRPAAGGEAASGGTCALQ